MVAQVLGDAATHAPPQHYMITLPPTPVGEVAEVVLGQSLGLPYKIDADVNAEMAFKVDGLYGPQELAREFGYRLWNVDVALIERPSDGLWLIPEAELSAALAAGATVVSPLASTPARAPRHAAAAPPVDALKDPGGADWSWLGWLAAGWATGAGAVLGGQALRRRRAAKPVALLAAPLPAPQAAPAALAAAAEDDLIIPDFRRSARPAAADAE